MAVSEPETKSIWFSLIPGLLLLAVMATAVFGEKGILCAVKSSQQKEKLQAEVRALEEANLDLRKQIESLRSDPRYLESIARQELGMVRQDELVYQFRSPNKTAEPIPAGELSTELAEPDR